MKIPLTVTTTIALTERLEETEHGSWVPLDKEKLRKLLDTSKLENYMMSGNKVMLYVPYFGKLSYAKYFR